MKKNYSVNLRNYIIQTQTLSGNYKGKLSRTKDKLSKININYLLSRKPYFKVFLHRSKQQNFQLNK